VGGVVEFIDDTQDFIDKTIADGIKVSASLLRKNYQVVGDNILGIDDEKFLGLKGYAGQKLGTFTKDALDDHAEVTVIIVASYFGGAYLIELYPELYISYEYLIDTAFTMVDYYLNSVVDSMKEMVLPATAIKVYTYEMFSAYKAKLSSEINFFNMNKNGSISLWLAGGAFYNSTQAGGELYSTLHPIDRYAKVFGYADDVSIKEVLSANFPYDVLSGGKYFDSEYKKLLI
jgi:hypothetical protein